MIDLHIQWPKNIEKSHLSSVIAMQIHEGTINFDPLLREFLSYTATENELKSERISKTISNSNKQPFSKELSIQSSSECDRTLCQEKENAKEQKPIIDLIETWKKNIFIIEIKPIQIYHTNNLLESSKPSDSLHVSFNFILNHDKIKKKI